MTRPRPVVVIAAAAAALAGGLAALSGTAHAGTTSTATASTAAASTATGCRAWTGQHPPYAVWVTSVVALSPCDVWAAGIPGVNTQAATVTDLLHWNGAGWTLHTSPAVPAALLAVPSLTATSASDVWVAGSNAIDIDPEGLGVAQTLIAHWNGTALSRLTTPDPGTSSGVNLLTGVSASARNNAWAAGFYSVFDSADETSQTYPLALHWNGGAWTQVRAAMPQTYGRPSSWAEFSAVQAHCGCAPWAVGQYDALTSATGGSNRIVTLTERWTGGAWHVVASPDLSGQDELAAISADSGNDAWAVGYHSGNAAQTLAEHWNGHAWKIVASPSPGRVDGKQEGTLVGVAAISPRDAWAVGTYVSSPAGKTQALLLHWNGTSWRQVALPHFGPKGEPNVLTSVSASPTGNVIVGGYYSGHVGDGQQALVFRAP